MTSEPPQGASAPQEEASPDEDQLVEGAAEEEETRHVDQQESLLIVSMEVALEIELPTGTILPLAHINKSECGIGIRQALSEFPESCFYTSYALFHQGEDSREEVNDYVDLNDYPFLTDGTRLKMVLEDYDVRKARNHVKRFRELMAFPPVIPRLASGTNGPKEDEENKASSKGSGKREASTSASAASEGTGSTTADTGAEVAAAASKKGEQQTEEAKELARAELRAMVDRFPDLEILSKVSLASFYPTILGPEAVLSKEVALPQCLRSLCYSGWNPPPTNRRLLGDLFYLEVRTLDDAVLHITAIPGGFYVNKTHHDRFNPSPAVKMLFFPRIDVPSIDHFLTLYRAHHDRFDPSPAANCYFSHELISLLSAASLPFKKAWGQAVQQASEHAKFDSPLDGFLASMQEGRIEAATTKPTWNVPMPPVTTPKGGLAPADGDTSVAAHKYDVSRCEDDLANTFGMDERGALRDWNEDYQNVREMKATSSGERIVKAKVLHKVLTEFGEAALAGAVAVIQGFVTPINPNEPKKSHVYIFNNIFFSHAADSQNTFKMIEGDGPAFKGALHEIRNLININKLGIEKLYTLATSVIDYLGVRLVAQSIIPGILHGDQQSRLMYGSVEAGVKLRAKQEMGGLLEEVAKKMYLTQRRVPLCPIKAKEDVAAAAEEKEKANTAPPLVAVDEEDEEEGVDASGHVNFIGPVEWKGIKGADGRCYLLDLIRLTPRDPNWIPAANKGTGLWEGVDTSEGIDALEEDFSVVLRPELIDLYVRSRAARAKQKIIQEYQMKKAIESGEKKQLKAKEAAASKEEGEGKKNGVDEAEGEEEGEEEDDRLDEETQQRIKEEESKIIESLKINPNAFLPLEGLEDQDQEQLSQDEEQIRVLGRFLWEEVIPSYLEDIKRGGSSPIDGEGLTDNLHQTGINIRYLGRLATLAKAIGQGPEAEKRFRIPRYFVQLCESEMLARAVKHLIFQIFKDREDLRSAPGPTLVAVLNAVLGQSTLPQPLTAPTATEEGINGASHSVDNPSSSNKRERGLPSSPTNASSSSSSGKASKKNKHRHHKKHHHHHHANGGGPPTSPTTLNLHPQKTLSSPPITEHSLEDLREMILSDIRKRYRYNLNSNSNTEGDNGSLPNPIALLRRICQKLGLRVLSREYDFGGREPLCVKDVIDVQPTAKHSAPPVALEEAKELMDSGRILAHAGNVSLAYEYLNEAASMYQQVLGPLHVEVGRCMDLMATILFQAGEQESGLDQLKKALAMFWQTGGFDTYESINAHHALGLFLQSLKGRYDEAIFHHRACIYLLDLIAGPTSPELPTQYYRLAITFQELGLLQQCRQFLLIALDKSRHVSDSIQEASLAHQVAVVEAALGQFKEALSHEKLSYSIFKDVLGEGHPKAVESSVYMATFTQKAVEKATDVKRLEGRGVGGRRVGVLEGVEGARVVDEWTADLEKRTGGGGGGGGGRKKKGGKRK